MGIVGTNELIKKLEECQMALEDYGAIGIYLFDFTKEHGARIAVHMSSDNMPKGKAVYDTDVYDDYVVKNVVIGNVAFFCLLTLSEAFEEGVPDFWGVLN